MAFSVALDVCYVHVAHCAAFLVEHLHTAYVCSDDILLAGLLVVSCTEDLIIVVREVVRCLPTELAELEVVAYSSLNTLVANLGRVHWDRLARSVGTNEVEVRHSRVVVCQVEAQAVVEEQCLDTSLERSCLLRTRILEGSP